MDFFTAEQIEILSQGTVRCDFLLTFAFGSGTKRAWNGDTQLVTAGETYEPMHGAGKIEGIGLSAGTLSDNVTLTIDGIPGSRLDILAAAVADSVTEISQRLLTVALQLFDSGWQPVGDPLLVWIGFMQPPKITRTPMQDGEGAVQAIKLTAENIFYGRSRPPGGRYTDRDQQLRSPGDKFLQFVNSIVDKEYAYPVP